MSTSIIEEEGYSKTNEIEVISNRETDDDDEMRKDDGQRKAAQILDDDEDDDDDAPKEEAPEEHSSQELPLLKDRIRNRCCPHGASIEGLPLALCIIAVFLTGFSTWHCSFFRGADIGFTGGMYGLWTIQDVYGKCQLYDVLFFSYHLGPAMGAARFMSFSSLLLGLAMVTTMSQALQYHVVSWGIGFVFFILAMVSVFGTKIFNVWIVFWACTYILLNLIVRGLLIHPVHRRISKRGSLYIAACMFLCSVLTGLTFSCLKSSYCTCSSLTVGDLEGRIEKDCVGDCQLAAAGYCMIVACIFWTFTAIATQKIGVQPEHIAPNPSKSESMYGHYSRESITTRAQHLTAEALEALHLGYNHHSSGNDGDNNNNSGGDNNNKNNNNGPKRSRNYVEKICCDFRVKERSRNERILFWIFRVVLGLFVLLYLGVVILMIGQRVENDKAQRAPDTSKYFILDPVCAFNPDNVADFQTFDSVDKAHAARYKVAHCGACSYCSNMPDIKTYVETRKTIAVSAKKCGPKAVLQGYDDLVACLEKRINFSRDCTRCWADDMKTDASQCLFTCVNTMFTGFITNNNVPGAGSRGWMNHCIFCDERLAGPAFVTCSGVARRRLGITSEIERNPEQQCKKVDVDWVNVDWENVDWANYTLSNQ